VPSLHSFVELDVVGFRRKQKCGKGARAGRGTGENALQNGACNAGAEIQTVTMSDQDQAEIRLEFARLKQEHADFDAAINAMIATGCDPLQIQRMKKKKLMLKDRLKVLENSVVPDIIA
jgi:hypothetical protein